MRDRYLPRQLTDAWCVGIGERLWLRRHPTGLTAHDVDLIKLTAQYTAAGGKQFLATLARKESTNEQFQVCAQGAVVLTNLQFGHGLARAAYTFATTRAHLLSICHPTLHLMYCRSFSRAHMLCSAISPAWWTHIPRCCSPPRHNAQLSPQAAPDRCAAPLCPGLALAECAVQHDTVMQSYAHKVVHELRNCS
jgi:Surp module